MDSKVNHALVGLFVIILSLAMIAIILWLSVGTEDKIYDKYQAYMNESVSGLNLKAPVKYRGVNVGQVVEISLVPDRPNDVFLLLEIERGTPIKADTYAILSTQGLTGLAFIELTGGSVDAPLPTRQNGSIYPEIQTKPSLLVRVDSAITVLSENLNKVSEVADDLLENISHLAFTATQIFSKENSQIITQTLKNVENLSADLTLQIPKLNTGIDNVSSTFSYTSKLGDHLTRILVQLEKSLASIEKTAVAFESTAYSFEKTAKTVGKEVGKAVAQGSKDMAQTTETIADATTDMQKGVTGTLKDVNFFTQQALPEMTNSLRELRELLTALRAFSRELENKPNMLLFGKSKAEKGPGE